jgi:hypothetical protein
MQTCGYLYKALGIFLSPFRPSDDFFTRSRLLK